MKALLKIIKKIQFDNTHRMYPSAPCFPHQPHVAGMLSEQQSESELEEEWRFSKLFHTTSLESLYSN